MKKLMIGLVVIALVAVTMLSGCVKEEKEDYSDYKNCGTNVQCFQDSLMKCEKAIVNTDQEFNGFSIKVFSAVKGGSINNCTVFFRIEDITVPGNASFEEKMGAFLFKGKEAECSAPIEIVKQDLSNIDFEQYCHGSLVDLIKTASSIQQQE